MTRSANLYISSQLHRWLRWLAEIKSETDGNQTADAVAEDILRRAILANVPNIDQLEADYVRARRKLDEAAVRGMKANE